MCLPESHFTNLAVFIMLYSLVFGLVLCSVSVKSCKLLIKTTLGGDGSFMLVCIHAVTVTWNGTTITGPVLIFQDELVRDDRTDVLATPVDGTLICRSENQAQVGWHFTNGIFVLTITTGNIRQRRTSSSATPSVSKLTTNRPDEALTSAAANGLWTCRLNGAGSTAVPVGIYARGGGKCVIVAAYE